jgi:hypothetical protein
MKQMEIPEEMRIDIDYNNVSPSSVKKFRPSVFRDGHYSIGIFNCMTAWAVPVKMMKWQLI